MDLDWCLSCGRRVANAAPYCSHRCYVLDNPLLIDTVHSSLPTHDIRTWATQIPAGHPAGAPPPPPPPPLVALRPPKLLLSHQRPVPPTLSMSTPLPARPRPSLPILTPLASLSLCNSTDSFSSPPQKNSVFAALATHVRSWVSPPPPPPPLPRVHSPFVDSDSPLHSAAFTVLAKTHNPLARHILPSSNSSIDDTDDDTDLSGDWWLASALPNSPSSTGKNVSDSRPRRITFDHPAFSSRGRKLSRAVV